MSGDSIPQAVQTFIRRHIRSVVELEALLLLQREPQKEWTAAALGQELRVGPAWAERELEDLTRWSIVTRTEAPEPMYHYAATGALSELVAALARAYSERRVSVIEFIFARPSEPIQNFADAFRLRKERPDG